MRIVTSFPHRVREIENCWIPLPDGARLAARVWLPEDALARPVPAIVEYLPYRKRDRTRWRDEPMHRYFAGHGYAAVRIDLRGAGESDGLLLDEYTEQELEDGVAALAWLAEQPWCTGAVGMMGKSWGGFNALQVAARRPPSLAAVITVCSTDDRYADDAHYMGGCLLNENLLWGSALLTITAQPPDPLLVGDHWREIWLHRLEHLPLFVERWLHHQRRDEYWKHGSVCEDYEAIRCPVYAIGGWADAYTNAVPRLLAGLRVPRKGLVGPWAHLYPHEGVPGPAIGFLQEALRWWDHWLKGTDTGIMDEPMYRVWMQESVPPRTYYAERPGRWVAEEAWPSPRTRLRQFTLLGAGLREAAGPEQELTVRSPPSVGVAGGRWCSFGVEGDLPGDQREDDARALTFDSPPLTSRLEILGAPVVLLTLAVDRSAVQVAVRLEDVAADGASTRVTYGLLNLTHRDGHEWPEPLVPGRRYAVRIPLNDVAYVFPAGHCIRLAISSGYWPIVWPAPEPVTVTVVAGLSALQLPERPARPEDGGLAPFPEPEAAPPLEDAELERGGVRRTVKRNAATGETAITTTMDLTPDGEVARLRVTPIDLEFGHAVEERHRIRDGDPLSARAEVVHRTVMRRGAWSVRIETRTECVADRRAFRVRAELDAFEGDVRIYSKTWDCAVPRELV